MKCDEITGFVGENHQTGYERRRSDRFWKTGRGIEADTDGIRGDMTIMARG